VTVAHNRALLVGLGITHVVNCAGVTAASAFPEAFEYTTLFVDDAPGADLLCHLPRVVAALDECRASGPRPLPRRETLCENRGSHS